MVPTVWERVVVGRMEVVTGKGTGIGEPEVVRRRTKRLVERL